MSTLNDEIGRREEAALDRLARQAAAKIVALQARIEKRRRASQKRAVVAVARLHRTVRIHFGTGQTHRIMRFIAWMHNSQRFEFEPWCLSMLDPKLQRACLDFLEHYTLTNAEIQGMWPAGLTDYQEETRVLDYVPYLVHKIDNLWGVDWFRLKKSTRFSIGRP
ncbi:MAG: hypothetical protein QOF42_3099 [Gammaproteobacteria bacterium]|nr:hypothetical protein [Gammaproteobacteria bacterium]